MRVGSSRARRQWSARLCGGIGAAAVALLVVPTALAQDAADWLQRAATAARQLNYVGTIVYQHAGRVETSRLYHLSDSSGESEKLSNLDGPAREIIRNGEQVRCYYPDAKVIRVEPRSMHNAFPSLLPQQLARWPPIISSARRRSRASPGSRPRRTSSSPRMGRATATSSGPTSAPGSCSRH